MSVSIRRDVVFSYARIGYEKGQGPMQILPLKLDCYLPDNPVRTPTPALVLAHGGVFHRGSKEADAFSAGVGTSTPIAEYCRRFAELGLAAFSVQYRLAHTDPEPSPNPVLTRPDEVPMSRVSALRAEMGLPSIEPSEMARVMEAAFEDLAAAVRWVKAHHQDLGIDPRRVVLGGFSAGGRSACYVAYGKGVEVAGVFSISGSLMPVDAKAYLAARQDLPLPPLLMISGEHDLDYVAAFVPEIERQFRTAARPVEWAQVPGANHFYSSESPTGDGRTVFDVIRDSVASWFGLPLDVSAIKVRV
ncbi:MAG TPA: alpha/beta hydrolase [Microvirga sp.]|nr:alpha/beta hydrolase [Microvirga sp.]